jgi:predicted DNA-binding transcriptional regulator YafY
MSGKPQRLIALLAVLQVRRVTTAEALAAEFGVSVRTILRDIQALIDADIPVLTERGKYGGISLLPGSQADLSKLTASEADVIRAVGFDLGRAARLGAETAARSAAGKLTAKRRAPLRGDPPLALSDVLTVDNRGWFAADESPDVASLARDLRLARRLRVRYRHSGAAESQVYVVDPYGLLLRADRWYLIADSESRPRMYALTRLEHWELLAETRRLRAGATLAGTAAELGRSLESRHEITVTALLDADRVDIARRILGSRLRSVVPGPVARDNTTVSDTTASSNEGGRATVTIAFEHLNGVRQLLQFSDRIEVTSPPEARQLICRLAEQLAHKHR